MSKNIPLLVVCGPTASGKTRLSIDLAKYFDGEIIGADSMQIYKHLSVGTAKPTTDEMQGIPHHLVDFLEPGEKFSVAQYVKLANEVIEDVTARGHLPVLAGGTGLYISSLVDNISFESIESDTKLRGELQRLADEKGGEYLLKQLTEIDEELAKNLHPNNLGRIIRALEVYRLTGITMSEHQRKSRQHSSKYNPCMLGLCYNDREKLYKRIDARVELMLEQGLLEEAKSLFDKGKLETATQAIGYKELYGYFSGGETLDEAVANIKRETRRYAKRQMTWFRRDGRINWIAADDFDSYNQLLEKALILTRDLFGKGGTS